MVDITLIGDYYCELTKGERNIFHEYIMKVSEYSQLGKWEVIYGIAKASCNEERALEAQEMISKLNQVLYKVSKKWYEELVNARCLVAAMKEIQPILEKYGISINDLGECDCGNRK